MPTRFIRFVSFLSLFLFSFGLLQFDTVLARVQRNTPNLPVRCLAVPQPPFGIKPVYTESVDRLVSRLADLQDEFELRRVNARLEDRKKALLDLMRRDPDKALQFIGKRFEDVVDTTCVEQKAVFTGTLLVEHVDFLDDTSETRYALQSDGRLLSVFFSSTANVPFISGTKLRFTGYQLDESVLVADSDSSSQDNVVVLQEGDHTPVDDQKTIVILANFQNTEQPSWNTDQINDVVFTHVHNYYVENSFHKVAFIGKVMGWYTLPMDEYCGLSAVADQAIKAVDSEVYFPDYERVLIYAPYESCGFRGIGSVGSRKVETGDGTVELSLAGVKAGMDENQTIGTTAHELGHNFGLFHSGFYDCGTRSVPGDGYDCRYSEYGDLYTVLGQSTYRGHFNVQFKEYLGWLKASNIQTVSQSGQYTVKPLEIVTDEVQSLKIQRAPEDFLYVEYRQPIGTDAIIQTYFPETNVYDGASFHIRRNNWPDTASLIDAMPPGDSVSAALPIGQFFVDPATGTKVTTVSQDDVVLTVDVVTGKTDFTPPQVAITAPGAGEMILGNLTVKADAIDSSGIKKVEFYYTEVSDSDAPPPLPFGTDTSAPYQVVLDTTQLSNGQKAFYAVATDLSGETYGVSNNQGSSPSVTASVSNGEGVPPQVSITSPVGQAYVHNFVSLVVSASDDSGVMKVELYQDVDSLPLATLLTEPYTFTWDSKSVADGKHTFHAVAYDVYNNKATSAAVEYTVDNTSPTVSITTPVDDALVAGNIKIEPTYTDNFGLAYVDFYKDQDLSKFARSDVAPFVTYLDTKTLSDGQHSFQVFAYDYAKNYAYSSETKVIVDNAAPTAVMIEPLNGQTISAPTFTIKVNASDANGIKRVSFMRDEGVFLAEDMEAPYELTLATSSLSAGSHRLYAKVVDKAENSIATDPVDVTVLTETQAPVVEITSPVTGSVVRGSVHIHISAADDTKVALVELYKNAESQPFARMTTAPYEYVWDTTSETAFGQYTLQVVAYDEFQNKGYSEKVSVTVDNNVPQLSIYSPENEAVVRGVTRIKVSAYDQSSIKSVSFYHGNSDKPLATLTQEPFYFDWDTTSVLDGEYELFVAGTDAAGNSDASPYVHIKVDNTLPLVYLYDPVDGQIVSGSNVLIRAGASDMNGISYVTWYLDKNLMTSDTNAPYEFVWNATKVEAGEHTIFVQTADRAGNVASTKPITVIVQHDVTPPQVSLIEPADTSVVRGKAVTVSATASDDVGVTKVDFYLNGSLYLGTAYKGDPYAVTWDTTGVLNRRHAITAVAYDAAGHKTVSEPHTVVVFNSIKLPKVRRLIYEFRIQMD